MDEQSFLQASAVPPLPVVPFQTPLNLSPQELERLFGMQYNAAAFGLTGMAMLGPPVATQPIPMVLPLIQVDTEQVGSICTTLDEAGDIEQLDIFLWALPIIHRNATELYHFEPVVRARALLLFHHGLFSEMRELMRRNCFTGNCDRLRELWYESIYREQELVRGRPLTNNQRYGLRRQLPFPHQLSPLTKQKRQEKP
uniref:Homeobox protein SIX1 N-terminal SD domain-containing protein n=1 Tax=Plectus sambesii TaxID=2011161 RepID=A0A914VBU3_9BILA